MSEVLETPPERPLDSALTIGLVIDLDEASVKNDTISLGLAVADLRREGWYLKRAKTRADGSAVVELTRTWSVHDPPTPMPQKLQAAGGNDAGSA